METTALTTTPLDTGLQIISAALLIYTLLLSLRIILTWFKGPDFGRPWEYLCRITDPYLSLFRRIRFLHMGMFDFSPLAGILVLVILQNVVIGIGNFPITVSNVLAIILQSVWWSGVWIVGFFIILCAIRTAGLIFSKNQTASIWHTLDIMIQGLTSKVSKVLHRDVEYIQALLITLVTLLVFLIVGGLVVRQLVDLLFGLSF